MPQFPKLTSHSVRWLTGFAIGLPVLASVCIGPPWSWFFIVELFTAIGLWELRGLFLNGSVSSKWQTFCFAAGLLFPAAAFAWGVVGLHFIFFVACFAAFSIAMLASPLDPAVIPSLSRVFLTWIYVPYLISYILPIGFASQGRAWVMFVLLVIVAGDAGAYHTGRKYGRHKLYETVSPKKTMEGALGGLLLSLFVGTLFGIVFIKGVRIFQLLGYSFCIALTGQIGDLIESMLKRNRGVKDSGNLLPGHGGILDRLDSLLFSFPLMWFLLKWAD